MGASRTSRRWLARTRSRSTRTSPASGSTTSRWPSASSRACERGASSSSTSVRWTCCASVSARRIMSLLRRLKRPLRDALRHRAELREQLQWQRAAWVVEREIDAVVSAGRTIVAGPWLSEVGFETLYWVPFLRWVKAAFRLDPARVVAVSRGGVASWYEGIASRYVEIWDHIDPAEFARRTGERGATKQLEVSEFDREVVRIVERVAGERVAVLHPSLMYRLFSLFWSGQRAQSFLDSHTRFERIVPPRMLEQGRLPRDYVAVKFYAAQSLPDTPDVRRTLAWFVDSLAERTSVLLLDTGLALDEHADYSFGAAGRVMSAKTWMTPANNLGVQTEIIAGAQAFVGTCGSVAWLAPMLGVNTSAVYVDPKWLHAHLGVMLRASHRAGAGPFAAVDLRALDPLARPLAQGAGLMAQAC